ncbi:MAG: class I SAM-dependent methyltransferase [bacterium]|nr:class I SAM-dependent methyltransferase [Candidatus Kapabacteria bacterium]
MTLGNARLEREAAFHDQTGDDYTREPAVKFYAAARNSHNHFIDTVRMHARDGRVLDYGCGTGGSTCTIAQSGARVTGIDISPGAIAVAQQKVRDAGLGDRVDLHVMNAEELAFDDNTFDVVCGSSVLHHLDLDACYREIHRVLKPGGVAVFDEPLGHNPLINWYRNRTPEMRTVDEHPMMASDIDMGRELFADVDIRYFHISSLATVPFRNTALFNPMYAVAEALDRLAMRLIPPLRMWAWRIVMVMRK